jgi:hypothetical protein
MPSNLTRWTAMIGMFVMALAHLTTVPHSFHVEAYLGVVMILAVGMSLANVIALLMSDTRAVWMFTLYEGVANAIGYVVTRLTGLPFAQSYTHLLWSQTPAVVIALTGVVAAGCAIRTLHRRRGQPSVSTPVTSAQQRDLLLRSACHSRPHQAHAPVPLRKVLSKSSR